MRKSTSAGTALPVIEGPLTRVEGDQDPDIWWRALGTPSRHAWALDAGQDLRMNPSPTSVLETTRLLVRPTDRSDMAMLLSLYTDAVVRRHLGGAVEGDEAVRRAEVRVSASGSFTVLDRASGARLGWVAVSDQSHVGLELSYEFMPEAWGYGFAAEAATAVLDWAFNTCALDSVLVVTQAANEPSRRLIAHLGAMRVDEFEEYGATQERYRIERR